MKSLFCLKKLILVIVFALLYTFVCKQQAFAQTCDVEINSVCYYNGMPCGGGCYSPAEVYFCQQKSGPDGNYDGCVSAGGGDGTQPFCCYDNPPTPTPTLSLTPTLTPTPTQIPSPTPSPTPIIGCLNGICYQGGTSYPCTSWRECTGCSGGYSRVIQRYGGAYYACQYTYGACDWCDPACGCPAPTAVPNLPNLLLKDVFFLSADNLPASLTKDIFPVIAIIPGIMVLPVTMIPAVRMMMTLSMIPALFHQTATMMT